jgi:uncharacterized protein YwgA
MATMEGLKRKAVVLSLIEKMDKNNSWCGETHVQKCSYFLQEGLGIPLGYDFILYKHGPFSFDLRDELTEMRSNNFVVLQPQYPYGPSLSYGDLADDLKKQFPKTIAKYESALNYVAKNISRNKVNELEKLATALYIIKEERIVKKIACAKRMNEIKPHITLEDAKAACEDVDQLLRKWETSRS